MLVTLSCGLSACDAGERVSAPTTVAPTTAPPPDRPFDTLPAVDRFIHPTGALDVVAQVSVRVPRGPDVPLLTLYGDGQVIAATRAGWRMGRVTELDVQGLLDDADEVGLLDEPLLLRGPDAEANSDTGSADITVRFDVDGRQLVHELDLVRIERPVSIRAFLNAATVENRFDLTTPFEPGEWITCDADAPCAVGDSQQDATSRPVLPHENAATLTSSR